MTAIKYFKVADGQGNKTLDAEQLDTFAYYVQGVQFRFVVTRLRGSSDVVVTHRASGKRICAVPHGSIIAALGDYKRAAVSELQKLVAAKGEARVRSVLAAAE